MKEKARLLTTALFLASLVAVLPLVSRAELCPPEYSLCRSVEEEGVCVSRRTCLLVNDEAICTHKNSCFEYEAMSCYDHLTCTDILPFNKTLEFCERDCSRLLRDMAYRSSPLSMRRGSSEDSSSSRELSMFHTCLGICNVDGFPYEPLDLMNRSSFRLECNLREGVQEEMSLVQCSLRNTSGRNRSHCKKRIFIRIKTPQAKFPVWMSHHSNNGMNPKRFKRQDISIEERFKDSNWNRWFGYNPISKERNKEKPIETMESLISIDALQHKQSPCRCLEDVVNDSCKRICDRKKYPTFQLSLDCDVKENVSIHNLTLSRLSCAKTNLSCFFQDSNCTQSQAKKTVKLNFKDMWKNEPSRNGSCEAEIELIFNDYSIEASYWNFTCDSLSQRNRTQLPRQLFNTCVYRWYEGKFIHYDESACNLKCNASQIECKTFLGILCVDSIKDCEYVHGERKEKLMRLVHTTLSGSVIAFNLSSLFSKDTKSIEIEKVHSNIGAFVEISSRPQGIWKNVSEGMFLGNGKDNILLRLNFPKETIGAGYITLVSYPTESKGINELKHVPRRLFGFIFGYKLNDTTASSPSLKISPSVQNSVVSVQDLLPKDLYKYWLDHQMCKRDASFPPKLCLRSL